MAAHYRDVIADALQQFDENDRSRQFYEDLAWEGLILVDPTWNSLPKPERDRIKSVINNYITQKKNEVCN